MKIIEDDIRKVDVGFMPFFGKVLEIVGERFVVSYWGGGGSHAHQTFILKNTKIPESGLREGVYVFMSERTCLIFEDEDELREGLTAYINNNTPDKHKAGNNVHVEKKMDELRAAK